MTQTLARRPRLIAGAAVTVVAALAVAGWTLAPRAADDGSGRSGPRLAIAVVAPVEPEIDPGSVLEVGTLNDGFDRAALDRRPVVDDPTWMPVEAYVGETWPPLEPPRMPAPTPVAYGSTPAPASTDPLADGSRSFGFDRLREALEPSVQDLPDRRSGLEWTPPLPASPPALPAYTQGQEYSSE